MKIQAVFLRNLFLLSFPGGFGILLITDFPWHHVVDGVVVIVAVVAEHSFRMSKNE